MGDLLSFAGSLFGSGAQIAGQRETNRTNQAIAREQMAFQERMAGSAQAFSERMANTQVQRRVQDLIAAGLNPALAYEGSAAAPSGVTAGGAGSTAQNPLAGAGSIIANALQAKELKRLHEENRAGQEDRLKILRAGQDKARADAETALTESEIAQMMRDQLRVTQPIDQRIKNLEAYFLGLDKWRAENDAWFEEHFGKGQRAISSAADVAGSLLRGAATAKGMRPKITPRTREVTEGETFKGGFRRITTRDQLP